MGFIDTVEVFHYPQKEEKNVNSPSLHIIVSHLHCIPLTGMVYAPINISNPPPHGHTYSLTAESIKLQGQVCLISFLVLFSFIQNNKSILESLFFSFHCLTFHIMKLRKWYWKFCMIWKGYRSVIWLLLLETLSHQLLHPYPLWIFSRIFIFPSVMPPTAPHFTHNISGRYTII